MKRFKTISSVFIVVIAVVFGFNVFYLVSLYHSIRNNIEREVMGAVAEADIDELWIRADRAHGKAEEAMMAGSQGGDKRREGEISVGRETEGSMVSTTRYADGRVTSRKEKLEREDRFTNKLVDIVGKQFHAVMDPYVEVDLTVMDSLLTSRLNDRFIYPRFVAAEITGPDGEVVRSNPKEKPGSYDVFTYCFNPDEGMSYRVCVTPLTRHIFSEMAGVIVTVFLLMAVFALAFGYLFRTVSRLRTIEEMKDDFVGNMTHELKTPIAIAYSANDALLNFDRDDPAKRVAYLKIANKQLKRLGELVENILALSMERRKAMRLKPEQVSLRPFIEEIAAAQRIRGDKEIEIQIDGEGAVTVDADRAHLSNVLNNLIDNAVKYSGDSVRIVIGYDREGISVADNGIGIPAKSVPYIFNKFYRVPHGNRQDVRGYGIGLYYVRSILDRMGWTISVKSKEGDGSVFTIKFSKDGKQDIVGRG